MRPSPIASVRKFLRWMALRDSSPEVVVAQVREVALHIPTLYVVVVAGIMMLVFIATDVAPWWLVIGIPVVVWSLLLSRIGLWNRMPHRKDLTQAAAITALRGTLILVLGLAILDLVWALAVLHYVGPAHTATIMVIVVFTAIGSIFCMMHLPQAAVMIVPIALLPWIAIYVHSGKTELAVLMAQVSMIAGLMIRVLNRKFRSFTDLVRSRSALARGKLKAQQLSEQNERFANSDSLSGLPNRRYFFTRLDALVGERQRDEAPFAVALFDLDRFKPVNDTYGHIIGDRLLCELGARLLAESGPDILIARLGGDEFGLLVQHRDADAVAIGQRICDLTAQPFQLEDLVVSIGCSMGLALYPEAGRSGRELLDRADFALYHRKTTVRGGLTLFTAEHERSIRSTQILEAAMQTADLDREMGLMYQPIVDTHRMTVVAVEALARWDSPVLGKVSPDQFIPVAESLGTIGTLTLNINTVGYKAVDSQFSTLVGDGRNQSVYSAGGVSAVPHPLISKQGLLGASSSSTDLGIDGQGFFVTRTGSDGGSSLQLTRAGSFTTNKEGFLTNTAGLFLQGWRLDANGDYANTGNPDSLEPIKVSNLAGSAAATTKIQMRINLKSTTSVNATPYLSGNLARGTSTPDYSKPFDVFDQQGGGHRLTFSVTKRADNQWAAEVYAVPATDVTAADGLIVSGTIKFNPDGSLDRANSSPALFAPVTPAWTNNAGSLPITLGLGTNGGLDGLTQFGSDSSLISSSVDGGMLGNINSVDVSDKGVVSVVFENGTKRPIYQLPIATVPNPDGLDRVNGNAFTISDQSGTFALNAPGALGAGKISSFKLEASTADLAQEFTNMIRFQRAYSASSKIITTADEMLQEVSNLKR